MMNQVGLRQLRCKWLPGRVAMNGPHPEQKKKTHLERELTKTRRLDDALALREHCDSSTSYEKSDVGHQFPW